MDAHHLNSLTDRLVDEFSPGVAGDGSLLDRLENTRPGVDDTVVLNLIVAVVRLRNVLDYLLAFLIGLAEHQRIPLRRKLKTGPDLLLAIGVAPVVAQRMGRLGRALHRFPTVAAGMRDGAVSCEFADAIVKGTEHVRRRVKISEEQRETIIRTLSVQLNPAAVMTRARAFAIELAPEPESLPEGAVPVAENTELNEMTLVQTDDGRYTATVDLDVLNGDALVTALDPLTKPIPQPDGSADPRSAARRRGDALAEVVRAYLYGYDRPTSGGVLPTVTVVRQAPVISSGLEIAIPELPDGIVPPADSLGFGGPITATSAELIACDAAVSEVLVDSEGVPLDVGRNQRLFTGKLRKALEVRDRGCAFPGCDRPAKWCDGHHMTPWSEGGRTCLDNGVLLCRAHHTMVHHTGWEVLLGPDRHPWFRPPVDPEHPERRRELIRSNARRTMTLYEHAAA